MKLILLLLSWLLVVPAGVRACECVTPALTPQTALASDYVALVRVVGVAPYQRGNSKYAAQPYYAAKIREVKRYKGRAQNQVVVMGGLPELGGQTSCDLGINVGEEWLIFGTAEEAIFVYPCGYTIRFRARDGFQELHYPQAFVRTHLLDSLTHQPARPRPATRGVLLTRYPSRTVQKSEHFQHGALDGAATYFYPDGQPYGTCHYRQGRLHGPERWYDEGGRLTARAQYQSGLPVDTTVFYMAGRPFFRHVYGAPGQLRLFQQFGQGSAGPYVSQQTDYGPAPGQETHRFYYPSGQLRSLGYRLEGKDWGTYQEFDEQGHLVSQWAYDIDGKVIKDSVHVLIK